MTKPTRSEILQTVKSIATNTPCIYSTKFRAAGDSLFFDCTELRTLQVCLHDDGVTLNILKTGLTNFNLANEGVKYRAGLFAKPFEERLTEAVDRILFNTEGLTSSN